jgi:toxin ParE1/3/4
MASVIWSETALQDLLQIREYISKDSHVYADSVIDQIYEKVEILKLFPNSGKEVIIANQKLHEIISSPFRILYYNENEDILILTIVHMKRDI